MKQKISVRTIITKGDKVLIFRRAVGRESILGKYELPGGRVDFREQPEDALARHILVQAKASLDTVKLSDVLSFIDPDDPAVQYIFIIYTSHLKEGYNTIELTGLYNKFIWMDMSNIQLRDLTNSTRILLSSYGVEVANQEENSKEAYSDDRNTTNSYAIIHSDGGSRGNPGPSAAGFIIMDANEHITAEGGAYLGVTTNNQAEYQAVYLALQKAAEMNVKKIDFRLDSDLVVKQMNGVYKIKNRDLWPIHERIKDLIKDFEEVKFSHVRREFNRLADGMVNKILDEHAKERGS